MTVNFKDSKISKKEYSRVHIKVWSNEYFLLFLMYLSIFFNKSKHKFILHEIIHGHFDRNYRV